MYYIVIVVFFFNYIVTYITLLISELYRVAYLATWNKTQSKTYLWFLVSICCTS